MMKDLTKDKTGQTVAEHIVEFLRHRGVKHVFGLCGHTNIAVLSCLLYTSPSPRDPSISRMPSSA